MAIKGPGSKWRFLAHGPTRLHLDDKGEYRFDELVVDDWLHIEQMSDREWWMRVGDARIWIQLDGKPVVTITRGEYEC